MRINLDQLARDTISWEPLLERLRVLFARMDRAYTDVAGQYGFECHGCADNCCLTRFYHHTLIEFLYLMHGMRTLEPGVHRQIMDRAQAVRSQMAAAKRQGDALRIMCPLNQGGRCALYTHRPMICRLHGVPHELQRPDGSVTRMPGCDAFFDQCRTGGKSDYIRFDRTPLYRQMVRLEKQVRQATGYPDPLRFTVAEMLTHHPERDDEID